MPSHHGVELEEHECRAPVPPRDLFPGQRAEYAASDSGLYD
jgi:hypothetical protein